MDFGILALAALIPLIIGFVWYNPMVFGRAWMGVAGVSEADRPSGGKMFATFLGTYVLSFLIAMVLQSMVIHQFHVFSILLEEPGFGDSKSEIGMLFDNFMSRFGNNFRTFKHGAFHGVIVALLFVTPIMAINAMFERKRFKYIAINAGYWILSLALMGGVVSAYVKL
jgi:hypothetical protein